MNSNNICIQDARWLEAGKQPGAGQISLMSPQVAEERWVDLEQWHSFSVGSRVWVLYQPPMSQTNGWFNFPEELDQSFVIECVILNFAPFWLDVRESMGHSNMPQGRTAIRMRGEGRISYLAFNPDEWPHFSSQFEVQGPAFVRCERILSLKDIPLHFAREGVFESYSFSSTRVYERSSQSQHLFYEARGTEGGGEWWVRTKESPSRVVLYAFEIVGEGLAQICNRPFHKP